MAYTLAIGVVADDQQALNALQAVLLPSVYQVIFSCTGADFFSRKLPADIDVWVLELGNDAHLKVADALYSEADAVILLGDGVPDVQAENYKRWQQRLLEKIAALVQAGAANARKSGKDNTIVTLAKQSNIGAEHLWVLAASLGGPETLPQFLEHLSPGLPVGFIYAQHTNSEQDKVLSDILNKQQNFVFKTCDKEQFIQAGEVLIAPLDYQIEIQKSGLVRYTETPWPKPYSPDINMIVAQVGKAYGIKSGVIVFTGMCDDGASGAEQLRQQGGEVWVQEPASCTCDAMPKAVQALDIVSRCASPQALAQAFNQRYSMKN